MKWSLLAGQCLLDVLEPIELFFLEDLVFKPMKNHAYLQGHFLYGTFFWEVYKPIGV